MRPDFFTTGEPAGRLRATGSSGMLTVAKRVVAPTVDLGPKAPQE